MSQSCALESQATPYLIDALAEALKAEGADQTKVDTARGVWEESRILCRPKEAGSTLTTIDSLQKGLYSLIEGTKECSSSQITPQLQSRLNAAIANCLAENNDDSSASRFDGTQS